MNSELSRMKVSCRARCRSAHRQFAFSFLEVLFVISILALLAGLATPRFANALAQRRLEGATRQLMADLSYAKRRARLSSKPQTIKISSLSRQYTIVGLIDPDRPARAYSVSLADEPYGVTALAADFGGDAELIFNGHGDPDSGGTITIEVGGLSTVLTIDPDTGLASAP